MQKAGEKILGPLIRGGGHTWGWLAMANTTRSAPVVRGEIAVEAAAEQ